MMQEGVHHGFGAPHNVGLEHTDQPWPTGAEPPGSFDDDFEGVVRGVDGALEGGQRGGRIVRFSDRKGAS